MKRRKPLIWFYGIVGALIGSFATRWYDLWVESKRFFTWFNARYWPWYTGVVILGVIYTFAIIMLCIIKKNVVEEQEHVERENPERGQLPRAAAVRKSKPGAHLRRRGKRRNGK